MNVSVEEVKRDPQLTLVDTRHPSMFWVEFADQWDPKYSSS